MNTVESAEKNSLMMKLHFKKIYNRGAKDFLCISCSSQYLQVSEELLLTKMQEFKDMGCTLFSSSSISEGLA